MRLVLAVLLAGCAGDPEPAAKATSAPRPLTIFERLDDTDGPVAGLPALEIVHRKDPTHCSGIAVETRRRAAMASIDDLPIENVLEIRFPSGLDFSEPHKATSLATFNRWLDHMQSLGAAARVIYTERIVADDATDEERVAAMARIVQVQRHLASTLLRAEIPVDVRAEPHAEEKIAAFCAKLEEVAEPIVAAAESAAKVCADHAADLGRGWWLSVCTVRPTVTASVAPSTSP